MVPMMAKNNSPPEEWEQAQFFGWVYVNQVRIPELELCNASLNGVKVGPKTRCKLKAQGLRPGWPDIDLPVKMFPFSGLKIELKRQVGGVVAAEQKRVHILLRQQGFRVEVCKGWREAVAVMADYLQIDAKV